MAATLVPESEQRSVRVRQPPVAAPHSGVPRYLGALVLVAVAYYLAGRVGLELAYLDGAVAAAWPPAGLGLAVLVRYGNRMWPGIVVGDLLLGDYSTPLG